MDFSELKKPFPANEVSWRIGQSGTSNGKVWAKVLAYIDNRCIQDRLDAVIGPANWKNEYIFAAGGVLCGISIKINGEWVTKWDGSDPSEIEAFKGSLSDSMKRAAVQWGMGRELYELGETFAEVATERANGFVYAKTKDGTAFFWKPPTYKAPGDKPAPKQVDQAPPAAESARDTAIEAWVADCFLQINAATSVEKLKEIWKEVEKQPGKVKDRVKPLFTSRKEVLQKA